MSHDRSHHLSGRTLAVARICPLPSLQRSLATVFAGWLFLAAIVLATQAWGQAAQFEIIEIAPAILEPANQTAMDRARKAAPGSREAAPGSWSQWNAFSAYYNQYLFPTMTQPGELTKLPAMNEDILKDLRRAQASGANEVAKAILSWSTSYAGRLATGNYHPAVRINATLLLASLNDRPPGAAPPLPAQSTLGPLVALYRDQSAPDGVRAAALIGLHRWTHYGLTRLNANARNGIVSMMLELANAPVPENRTAQGHAYLQRYALDMLQVLYTDARGAEITDAFVKLSTSPDVPPIISLYATAKLATLDSSAKVPEAVEVAKSWTGNVADIFVSEQERLLAMDPPKAAAVQTGPVQPQTTGLNSGMGMMSPDMYGAPSSEPAMSSDSMGMDSSMYGDMSSPTESMMDMGMGMGMGSMRTAKPQPPEIFASRRRLVHALECLKFGLTGSRSKEDARTPSGLVSKLPQEEQASVAQLNETLLEVLAEVNNKDYDTRPKFVRMLATQSKQLKLLSGSLGVENPAAPEEEQDPEPGFPTGPRFPGFGLPAAAPQ